MRRGSRAAAPFIAGLTLLACRGTERPDGAPAVTPAPAEPRPAPPGSPPPTPAEAAPAGDDFHELLSHPAAAQPQGDVPAQALAAAVERSNAASFALWAAFAEQTNFVVSPHSIRSALALLYLASSPGEGRNALQAGMRYPARNDEMDVRVLDGAVQVAQRARFESASAVWIARGRALHPAYLELVSRILPAELHAIDFAADPERAQQTINAWVSDRTREKIPNILQGRAITRETQATLVNAVYFFGEWLEPFDPELTARKPFRTAHGTTIKTETMVGSQCSAVFHDDYAAAYVDYADTSLVFVVVVPKRWRAFPWDAEAFRRVWAALDDSRDADFELPKFTLRSRRKLSGALGAVGVRMDDPQLLSGLFASGEPPSVGLSIHEAFIQVDETSTEAAAATAITAVPISEDEPPPTLRVDRPFYFLLVERRTGLVAFMGQVTDPKVDT